MSLSRNGNDMKSDVHIVSKINAELGKKYPGLE